MRFHTSSKLNPLVRWPQYCILFYEVPLKHNFFVHSHKLSLPALNLNLVEFLGIIDKAKALEILHEIHKLQYMCRILSRFFLLVFRRFNDWLTVFVQLPVSICQQYLSSGYGVTTGHQHLMRISIWQGRQYLCYIRIYSLATGNQ